MATKYYQKTKKKTRKEACERYQNLSEDEKEKTVNSIAHIIKIFVSNKNKG